MFGVDTEDFRGKQALQASLFFTAKLAFPIKISGLQARG